MTSPSATPGALTGRPYLCRACGRRLTALGAKLAHLASTTAGRPSLCRGVPELAAGAVTLDIARDDRAGITLPTAIQPVGRDQLEPGGAGQVEGETDAGRGHKDALATNAERVAYWTARMLPYGYVPGVTNPRTAAERLAELELRVVMACGAAGAAVVEAERSKL